MKHSGHPAFDTGGHNEEQHHTLHEHSASTPHSSSNAYTQSDAPDQRSVDTLTLSNDDFYTMFGSAQPSVDSLPIAPPIGAHSGDRLNQTVYDYHLPTSFNSEIYRQVPAPHPVTHEDRYNDAYPLLDPGSLVLRDMPLLDAGLYVGKPINHSEEKSTLKSPVVDFGQDLNHVPKIIINPPQFSRPSVYQFEPPTYPADIDALTPPVRLRSRNRTRAKADPSSTSSQTSGWDQNVEQKNQERAHSEPAQQQTSRRSSASGTYVPDPIAPISLDIPEDRSAGRLDTERTQKHPATFQCTLCPKRFTRAYNLRSHLRTHTDERPFVCSICGKAFARQTDRKRHEESHSDENKYVCRGSLKNNGFWGCGRRFPTVDALGSHFQSEAGCICIRPLQIEEQNLLRPPGDSRQSSRPLSKAVENRLGLPAALKAQHPALADLVWISQPDVSYNGDYKLETQHPILPDLDWTWQPDVLYSGDSELNERTVKTDARSSAHESILSSISSANGAITGSFSALSASDGNHFLGEHACNLINDTIIKPILAEESLKDFHPLVSDVPRRISEKNITNLRDLEKTLIFLAPVSRI
jgi:hypothetical protein